MLIVKMQIIGKYRKSHWRHYNLLYFKRFYLFWQRIERETGNGIWFSMEISVTLQCCSTFINIFIWSILVVILKKLYKIFTYYVSIKLKYYNQILVTRTSHFSLKLYISYYVLLLFNRNEGTCLHVPLCCTFI